MKMLNIDLTELKKVSAEDYAEIKELDRIILTELIEKITVGEARIVDGKKIIDVTIYYRFIGRVK